MTKRWLFLLFLPSLVFSQFTSTGGQTFGIRSLWQSGSSTDSTMWYFANNGNNANNGHSTETPKQTITHLNTLFLEPGDSVFFKVGDTFSTQLNITQSGNGGAPYYGQTIQATDLLNTQIGGIDAQITSYGFCNTHSGVLASLRTYILWSPGYGGGTGGSLKFRLQADSASPNPYHHPSGVTLDSIVMASPEGSGNFPLLTFASATPPTLTVGGIYHIVISNTDADPVTNFVSTDGMYLWHPANPQQPTRADSTWFQLLQEGGGSWIPRGKGVGVCTPILQLYYTDATTTGMGYMEPFWAYPDTVSGTKMVREEFAVTSASYTVQNVAIRLKRKTGSGALSFVLRKLSASHTINCSPAVNNGGFETAGLSGWATNSPHGSSTAAEDLTTPHSGTRCLKFYHDGSNYIYAYHTSTLTLTKDFYVSFWARTSAGYGKIDFCDNNSAGGQGFRITPIYTQYTGKIRAATGTGFLIEPTGIAGVPMTYFVDDIRVWQGNPIVMDSAAVAATSIDTATTWITNAFSSAQTLSQDSSYSLALQAPVGTVYETFSLQEGDSYGFDATTYFGDGFTEYSANGTTWSGLTKTGTPDRRDCDLQFIFSSGPTKYITLSSYGSGAVPILNGGLQLNDNAWIAVINGLITW